MCFDSLRTAAVLLGASRLVSCHETRLTSVTIPLVKPAYAAKLSQNLLGFSIEEITSRSLSFHSARHSSPGSTERSMGRVDRNGHS